MQLCPHEAVLATLALLQPTTQAGVADTAEQRLSSVYPQILSVQRRDPGSNWSSTRLADSENASRQTRHAALANLNFMAQQGRYQLVLAL